MNLNKKCPDCGQIISAEINQCCCGWRENKTINYFCNYKKNIQPCMQVATMSGRYGSSWYCKEHWQELRELGEL